MMTVDEIRIKMKDRRVSIVAQAIGVSKPTLYAYLSGRSDLLSATYQKLVEYLSK
jgi:predicted transcriptional regulator YheO